MDRMHAQCAHIKIANCTVLFWLIMEFAFDGLNWAFFLLLCFIFIYLFYLFFCIAFFFSFKLNVSNSIDHPCAASHNYTNKMRQHKNKMHNKKKITQKNCHRIRDFNLMKSIHRACFYLFFFLFSFQFSLCQLFWHSLVLPFIIIIYFFGFNFDKSCLRLIRQPFLISRFNL